MSAAAAPLLAAACAFPASLLTGSWVPNAYMDCGDAPLCGVLTLETGLGPGNYHHNKTGVHGLWPEVGQYGTSQCIGPTRSTEDPTKVYTCYNEPDTPTAHTISFEQHEWEKHGQCAGVADVEDFFGQVCSLAGKPVSLMEAARKSGHVDLQGYADLLQQAGYPIFGTDPVNLQVMLSACAGDDGKWQIADPSTFGTVCKGSGPKPVPPQPNSTGHCIEGKHGPPCGTNADCVGVGGCVRCAHSGFCTDVPITSDDALDDAAPNCDAIADHKTCDDSGCSWCLAGAVPPSCKTIDEAKQLPPSIFQCDKL